MAAPWEKVQTGVFISWPDAAGQASASVQNTTFTSANPLLDKIHSFAYMPDWVIKPEQPFLVQSKVTGTSTVFVTWGPPIGEVVTLKRLSWAVNAVSSQPVQTGMPGEENAADRIWMAIPVRFGRTIVEGEEWRLLDPDPYYKGECDEHARLMVKAMHILGIPAAPSRIYASTDSEVDTPEYREDFPDEVGRWLVMDFNTDPIPTWVGADWNAFEGVCKTAGRVYSIAPRHKGLNVRDFFNRLQFEQYWVKTRNNFPPGTTTPSSWGPPTIPPTPVHAPKPILTP